MREWNRVARTRKKASSINANSAKVRPHSIQLVVEHFVHQQIVNELAQPRRAGILQCSRGGFDRIGEHDNRGFARARFGARVTEKRLRELPLPPRRLRLRHFSRRL